ncbi:hypothetical protein MBLNU230_g5520t1 [Neophaeotheca triangularis]
MEPRGRLWLVVWTTMLFATCVAFFSFRAHDGTSLEASRHRADFKAPHHNVWAELSNEESEDVFNFVTKRFKDANVTFDGRIETLQPNKSDTAPYLYENGSPPLRYAKIMIRQAIDSVPHLVYYQVGPLPISAESTMQPLTYPFNSGRNHVESLIEDYNSMLEFAMAAGARISDITDELLGARVNLQDRNDPQGLMAWPRPTLRSIGGMTLWVQFLRPGFRSGARTLLPQGIYAKVNASGSNADDWIVSEWYYNGKLYANEDRFRSAVFDDPDFVSTPANVDGPWTDTEDFQSEPYGRAMPPPVTVQPYGPRYRLDREERFVSWFGFEFYFSTSAATGVSVHDIRFKGERVMYELGLQEAAAHYAGDDPMQGGLEFSDTFFGMGKMAFELVPGYDCPAYADFFDNTWHGLLSSTTTPNAICLFEFTADHLLSRHTAQYTVTASRNTYLTLRFVSTVGNYDYTIDYVFYLDGTIETKVRASGFIFAAFYAVGNTSKHEDEYGHRVHNALASSMHDHVINFKADLDVAGPSNDMVRMAVEPVTQSFPWDSPEVSKRNTMHLVSYPVTSETGLDWPPNSQEFYLVYNADQLNSWGERRGYRITPGTGMGTPPHLTIQNSTTLANSARWAEKDIWILRQKDTEPSSADPLNYLNPSNPIIDFSKMVNDESLKSTDADEYDGDLVLYFNLGAHHIPHSGDVPNTLHHTSASSVMFVPHNFADRDPSRESVQGVRLQLGGHNESGGFAGEAARDDAAFRGRSDLRSRFQRRQGGEKGVQARYFGGTYREGLELPLEQMEPDLGEKYWSRENRVTDLGFNGSIAGRGQ